MSFNNALHISVSITAKNIAYYRKKHCVLPQKTLHITAKNITYLSVYY